MLSCGDEVVAGDGGEIRPDAATGKSYCLRRVDSCGERMLGCEVLRQAGVMLCLVGAGWVAFDLT